MRLEIALNADMLYGTHNIERCCSCWDSCLSVVEGAGAMVDGYCRVSFFMGTMAA